MLGYEDSRRLYTFDAILRITKTYDDIGRVQTVTSYDDPDVGEGNVVNQYRVRYNRKLCAGGVEKGGVLWDNVWFT